MSAGASEVNAPSSSKSKGQIIKKRTADANEGDDETGAPKTKKRAKKIGNAADINRDDVDAMLCLGDGDEKEVKVKREPEEMRFGAGGDGGDKEEQQV
ncbi:uncharacterized protein EKO05_0004078 [Ascochyta rabiei]|nr:uncharacterized protein EKO05_0004078 [Ascochyta rabiei]UPX13576.1 hypothetical protein EKO05_0004078 [Ascochyta rabiei]